VRRHMRDIHKIENFVVTDENYTNLPTVNSTIYRCFPCSKSFNMLGYKLHVKDKHSSIEPPDNFDQVKITHYENLTKMMICLECQTRLGDPYALKKHMLEVHTVENYEILDDNYYDLPIVQSTRNLCLPCNRQFAKAVLYRLHIKNKHGSIEPEPNINPPTRESINEHLNKYMSSLPPSLKIKLVQPEPKTVSIKNWMCAQCRKCFLDQKMLRKHMQEVHKLEPLSLTKDDYMELPSVESTFNRCLPCNKTFPSNLRYRIHIKNMHDKKEPPENYDAEFMLKAEDFICLLCVRKFVSRAALKGHIHKFHLGSDAKEISPEKPAESKADDDTDQDPLADPLNISSAVETNENSKTLNDSPSKPLNESGETGKKKEMEESDSIKTVDIESITKQDSTTPNIDSTNDSELLDGNISENKESIRMNIDTKDIGDKKSDHESSKVRGSSPERSLKEEGNEEKASYLPISDGEDNKEKTPASQNENEDQSTKENDVQINKSLNDTKTDDDVMILAETKAKPPPKLLSEKEKELIDKMLHMLKKYGCAFCSNRFDTKHDLGFHEKSHLKEKKTPKKPKNDDEDFTPKVKRNTKMGSVQMHDNVSGPVCFKCSTVCKDNSNYKNHILSHYYREFDAHVPHTKPFECPVCSKPSRDKITLIRHYAFTHQKLFELTDITPDQLIPQNSGTPRTPKNKSQPTSNDSSFLTPKFVPSSPSQNDSMVQEDDSNTKEEQMIMTEQTSLSSEREEMKEDGMANMETDDVVTVEEKDEEDVERMQTENNVTDGDLHEVNTVSSRIACSGVELNSDSEPDKSSKQILNDEMICDSQKVVNDITNQSENKENEEETI